VFTDDVAARRALVKASNLVIVHSEETSAGLARIGAIPQKVAVIPHGPFTASQPAAAFIGDTEDFNPFRFLFIGRVKSYKGVEELLAAFEAVPPSSKMQLTIAGQCDDPELLGRLQRFANNAAISMNIGPERLPDTALSAFLAEANAVVLPFRNVTTSGSAILAISHGKPVIVPESANMIDIPESATIRYDGTQSGLVTALKRAASISVTELTAMSEAALKHAHSVSWEEIAARTKAEMVDLRDHTSPSLRRPHW
jgi:glycosyltransferase involved in cell wall biosynthesis